MSVQTMVPRSMSMSMSMSEDPEEIPQRGKKSTKKPTNLNIRDYFGRLIRKKLIDLDQIKGLPEDPITEKEKQKFFKKVRILVDTFAIIRNTVDDSVLFQRFNVIAVKKCWEMIQFFHKQLEKPIHNASEKAYLVEVICQLTDVMHFLNTV